MNYAKMLLDMGISLGKFTDNQLTALIQGAIQERNFRELYRREKLAEEYTDKLDSLTEEIIAKGMDIWYHGQLLNVQELSVNWKEGD